MGLFQHRPEEPTEWGGLPSEPLEPDPAGILPPAPDLDIPLFGEVPARQTIAYTAEPTAPIDERHVTDHAGDADDE